MHAQNTAGATAQEYGPSGTPADRIAVTNDQFLDALFERGARTWVCTFTGAPGGPDARWAGRAHVAGEPARLVERGNTYFCPAVLKPDSQERRKAQFERLVVLVADDPSVDALCGKPTYVLATSENKRQVGVRIKATDPDARDPAAVDRAIAAMAKHGLVKADKSGNNLVRYVRLPVGVNTKYPSRPAHRLEVWNPDIEHTLADALAIFGVQSVRADADGLPSHDAEAVAQPSADDTDDTDDWAGDLPGRLNVAQAESQIVSGEVLHENLVRLAAHFAARGLSQADIVSHLQQLMARSAAAGTERHAQRLAEIAATVRSALEKFAGRYADKVDFTDTGNVNLLAQLTKGDLRYVPQTKFWLYWTGKRWEADATGACAFSAARVVAEHYSAKAARMATELRGMDTASAKQQQKAIDAVLGWERQCRGRKGLENMVALASKDPRFVLNANQLDTHPLLLGVQNGVVDLRTGTLRPDARDEFVTMRCSVPFKPDADTSRFATFVDEVTGRPVAAERDAATGEVIPSSVGRYTKRAGYADYIQRWLGYSITGLTVEHKLITLYGEHGANGKNLLSDTVRHVLGDYAGKAKPELLMTSRRSEIDANRATPALAALRRKRYVELSEPRAGSVFDNAVVKSLTGDKVIAGRENFERTESAIEVNFKLWLLANLKPPVDHMEQAVVGRLVMAPFDRQWNRPGTVDRNPELPDADKGLQQRLIDEAEGVLAYLVQGAVQYLARGLAPCEEVIATTLGYFNEQEPVAKWMAECTTPCAAAEGGYAVDLFDAFTRWRFEQERIGARSGGGAPKTVSLFSAALNKHGITKELDPRNRRARFAFKLLYGVNNEGAADPEEFVADDALRAEICALGLDGLI